jgi:hypothetical protein
MPVRRAEQRQKAVKAQTAPAVRVTPEERWKMIAEAAYFRAQKRGFAPGDEVKDWLDAETEVAHQLGQR